MAHHNSSVLPAKAYIYNRRLIIGKLDACRRGGSAARADLQQAGRRGDLTPPKICSNGRGACWTRHACWTPGRLDAPRGGCAAQKSGGEKDKRAPPAAEDLQRI